MSPVSRILDIRLGGATERCHNIPHLGSYSVAAHSWGAAMLLHELWPEDFARLALIMLVHDVPEGWVGDIPSPTLRYSGVVDVVEAIEERIAKRVDLPHLNQLSSEDFAKVKACDALEFYLWCRSQLLMGNEYVRQPIEELTQHWREHPLPERAQRLFESLRSVNCLPRQCGVVKEAALDAATF